MKGDWKELEQMLICPVCRSPVRYVEHKFWCTSADCRRSYRIDEYDIVHIIEEEATVEPTAAPAEL